MHAITASTAASTDGTAARNAENVANNFFDGFHVRLCRLLNKTTRASCRRRRQQWWARFKCCSRVTRVRCVPKRDRFRRPSNNHTTTAGYNSRHVSTTNTHRISQASFVTEHFPVLCVRNMNGGTPEYAVNILDLEHILSTRATWSSTRSKQLKLRHPLTAPRRMQRGTCSVLLTKQRQHHFPECAGSTL